MFNDDMGQQDSPEVEALKQVLQELDEIKRYSGGTYAAVDNEVSEIRDMCRKMMSKLNEMDRQIDRIESFERRLNDMRSSLQKIERKV